MDETSVSLVLSFISNWLLLVSGKLCLNRSTCKIELQISRRDLFWTRQNKFD